MENTYNPRKVGEYRYTLQNDYIEKVKKILSKTYTERVPLALVKTYGCQQNINDGEKIQGMLSQLGYGLTDDKEMADIIIYNTCAIRENAEVKIFGNVGALKHYKMRKENLIIGICGCMVQQEHIAEKIKKSYPYVDLVFGTHSLQNVPEIVYKKLTGQKRVFDIKKMAGVITEGIPVKRYGDTRGWLSIMYGCDKYCTYCIVPHVRGRERSRKVSDIVAEFKDMLQNGFKDITLLGQNVNSYGKGLDKTVDFAQLLELLANIDGDFRLRFMTSHPVDFDRELVDVIARNDKICNHIHLPIQSGNDRILKAMNRHYTVEDYLGKVEYAKQQIKDVSFTSDIIVGFPGETYEEFKDTINIVEKVKFNSLFMFIYSKRKGTGAEKLNDNIPDSEKSKWFQELLLTQRVISKKNQEQYRGKEYRILVEDYGKSGEGYLTGKTEANIAVDFFGDDSLIGKFVNVKIVDILNWALLGEKVN